MRKFANSLYADYLKAIFIEKVIQYAKAFWQKQRLFGVFVTNYDFCCKSATKTLLDFALTARCGLNLEVFLYGKELAVLPYGKAIGHARNVIGHRAGFIHFSVSLKFIGQQADVFKENLEQLTHDARGF